MGASCGKGGRGSYGGSNEGECGMCFDNKNHAEHCIIGSIPHATVYHLVCVMWYVRACHMTMWYAFHPCGMLFGLYGMLF